MEMETLAGYLKQVREDKGVTLKDVEAATRVPIYYLEILEGGGDRRLVADKLFLVHFLRTYANFLQLEPEAVVARFLKERDRVVNDFPHPEIAAKPASVSRSLFVLLFILSASLITLFAYRPTLDFFRARTSTDQPPSSASQTQPQIPSEPFPTPSPASSPPAISPLEEKPKETSLPPLGNSLPETQTAQLEKVPPRPSEDLQAPQPDEIEPSRPEELHLSKPEDDQAQQPKELQSTKSDEFKPPRSQDPAQPASVDTHRLRIEATEKAWVRVTVDGKQQEDVLLDPGEAREWSAKEGFVLTFGNAGGVDLTLDGKRLPAPGASGEVVRNYRLFPADQEQR